MLPQKHPSDLQTGYPVLLFLLMFLTRPVLLLCNTGFIFVTIQAAFDLPDNAVKSACPETVKNNPGNQAEQLLIFLNHQHEYSVQEIFYPSGPTENPGVIFSGVFPCGQDSGNAETVFWH